MEGKKLRATVKAVLSAISKNYDWVLFSSRAEIVGRIRNLPYSHATFAEEFARFYPCEVQDKVGRLMRRGLVERRETEEGTEVKITDKGKVEVLRFKLEELRIEKPEKWDGKWRLVFFDIEEVDRKKRNRLRERLLKLGLKPMQRSVFISPYPLKEEVRFLREVLEVPHGVKLVTAEEIENDEELREMFALN